MRWPSSCASVAIKWSGGMARAPSVTKRVKYRQGEVVAGELHTLTLSVRMMAKPILQSLDRATVRRDGSSSAISKGSRVAATFRNSSGRGCRRVYPEIVDPQAAKNSASNAANARVRISLEGRMQDGHHA